MAASILRGARNGASGPHGRPTQLHSVLWSALVVLLLIGGSANASGSMPAWVHVDTDKRQVTFNIKEGGKGQAGQYNFNGYAHGNMTITVPLGWHVTLRDKNVGSTGHSLEIIRAPASAPPEKLKPAFKGAATKNLSHGIPPGSTDTISFTASRVGQYWMMCAVPGHALLGMWDHFVVSRNAKRPSVRTHS